LPCSMDKDDKSFFPAQHDLSWKRSLHLWCISGMVILRHLGRSHVRQLDKKIARRVEIVVGTRVETFTRFSRRWLLKYQDSFILISSVVG